MNASPIRLPPQVELFIAGDTPSAVRAKTRFAELLQSAGFTVNAVPIVDVLREPKRALDSGVIVTPALRVSRLNELPNWYYGEFDNAISLDVLMEPPGGRAGI